jgi:hypothetical protein
VRVVEVDRVDAEPAEAGLDAAADAVARRALRGLVRADLGGDDEVVGAATRREPAADDLLGLAAGVAGLPRGVDVGGVDEVAARCDVGVEELERGGLVGGPAEDVAAEGQGQHLQAAGSEGHACGVRHG